MYKLLAYHFSITNIIYWALSMNKSKQPYKILWYSLPCLIDSSNGAAISNKFILEQLALQGMEVKALNATIGDDPSGLQGLNAITEKVEENPAGFYQFRLSNIEYFVVKTSSTGLREIKASEQTTVWSLFVKLLEVYQPDIVIGYCPDLFSLSLRREAKARGIATAYAVCNASHDNFAFPDCDVVLTNSQAISMYYNRRPDRKTTVKPFGIVINPEKVLGPNENRDQRYITLVNPLPYKGIAVFIGLIRAFINKYPAVPLRFLVVKNRGSYDEIIQSLKNHDGSKFLEGPDAQKILSCIDVAEHTTNMKAVYALTKVMVCPSLCFEAWGMVATEANMSGIPVLANNYGGLPEAIGRTFATNEQGQLIIDDSNLGGIVVDPPASSFADNNVIPNDEEIVPYLAALEHLLTHDYSEQCAKASAVNDPNKNLERFKNYIIPLMDEAQERKTPLNNSFFLADSYMAEQREANAKKEAALQAQATAKDNLQQDNSARPNSNENQNSAYQGIPIKGVHQKSKKAGKNTKKKR